MLLHFECEIGSTNSSVLFKIDISQPADSFYYKALYR